MINRLFFNAKSKTYFLYTEDLNIKCCYCSRGFSFGATVFIHRSFSKKQYVKGYYCAKCLKKAPTLIYNEYKNALLTSIVPYGSTEIYEFKPTLSNSKANLTVFDADKIKSDVTIDNTKLAGRESIKGAIIGKAPKELDDLKDETKAIEYIKGMKQKPNEV